MERSDDPNRMDSLLLRIANGEPDAVQRCIDRYSGLIWSLARRYLGSEEAEDAVQEIFIELWKHAGRFNEELASEKTFIATIARRRLIDRGRKRIRRPTMEELPEVLADTKGHVPQAESETALNEVGVALGRLKPEHQRILQLSLVEGYSHSEISDALTLPLGTVKTILRRGIQRVRDEMSSRGKSTREAPDSEVAP